MALYVQGANTDTWHWCRNCSQYPSSVQKQQATRPSGDLCNQCKAKEREGTCRS